MADDLYNNDVVIDTTDELNNTTNSSSNISDDSSQNTPPSVTPPTVNPIDVSDDTNRIIDGWTRDTTATGGTAGETYNDTAPTEQPPLTPPSYKTVTRIIQEIITNYNQAYLQQLSEQGGKFYVYYTDGTRDEVDYTEIVDPYTAQMQSLVVEVDEITQANNQHFWYDDNGAHVTDEPRDSWEENAGYNFSDLSDSNNHNNLLMNSYGLIIRRALKNLAAFSRSAVTFYDGDGNETSNVLATFGKNGAIVGPSDSTRMIINSNGLRGIGGLSVPFLDVKLEGTSSRVLVSQETKSYQYSEVGSNLSIDIVEVGEIDYTLDDGDEVRIVFIYEYTTPDNVILSRSYSYTFNVGTPNRRSAHDGDLIVDYDGEQTIQFTAVAPNNYTITSYRVTIELYKTFRIPSFVFGLGKASGSFSFAEGLNTSSLGTATHAEGEKTIAGGESAHAEGYGTEASGVLSHAEGDNTEASNIAAHAEGSYTAARGSYSHAEGYTTKAKGNYSHAEGHGAEASGVVSHAEGSNTKAIGSTSHAEGRVTEARGDYSHAEGYTTIASGESSHAQNYYTKASSNYQTAIGKYNIEDENDTYAFIVGNGTANNARSNAFTVDWDGNIDFSGTLSMSCGGSGQNGTFYTATIGDVVQAASGCSIEGVNYCQWGKFVHMVIGIKMNTAKAFNEQIATMNSGKIPRTTALLMPTTAGDTNASIESSGAVKIKGSVTAGSIKWWITTYILA